jgi:hypothetical protein
MLVDDASSQGWRVILAQGPSAIALMGLSLSSILLVYTGESITRVFFARAAAFAALSLYSYTTKRRAHEFFCSAGVVICDQNRNTATFWPDNCALTEMATGRISRRHPDRQSAITVGNHCQQPLNEKWAVVAQAALGPLKSQPPLDGDCVEGVSA